MSRTSGSGTNEMEKSPGAPLYGGRRTGPKAAGRARPELGYLPPEISRECPTRKWPTSIYLSRVSISTKSPRQSRIGECQMYHRREDESRRTSGPYHRHHYSPMNSKLGGGLIEKFRAPDNVRGVSGVLNNRRRNHRRRCRPPCEMTPEENSVARARKGPQCNYSKCVAPTLLRTRALNCITNLHFPTVITANSFFLVNSSIGAFN